MSRWCEDDAIPYDEWLAQMEARYGKDLARVIAGYTPGPRVDGALRWAKHHGRRRVHTRGQAEQADAPPEAVDYRHHRARRESGR